MTTALSTVLFKDGATCGACYEIKCDPRGTKWCKIGNKSIHVTATNLCPPNPAQPSDNGGWCNMAEYQAGIVPVTYRRVPCPRTGGIAFTIEGNPHFYLIKVTNVGGAGDVVGLEVSGGKKLPWTKLKRNWGQKWELSNAMLVGQSLSFRVSTSDAQSVTLKGVTNADWKFGQTYKGRGNSV
ncbi:hypothetical protein Leryth_008872 [Lithospermum erythrorhizon]|nr:hypothetical protein Leryth_008872 [Lithospermum erythrorhizon]